MNLIRLDKNYYTYMPHAFFKQMGSCKLFLFAALLTIFAALNHVACEDIPFDVNYEVVWGNDHVSIIDQGREAQLSMDVNSGAGFRSKQSFGSGFFHLRIKLPNKDSAGVVTAFYLTSDSNNHDEVDFEFLGNKEGKPITLQTNVFANGVGDREQRILLWFDPSADFHTYMILWNTHQIVLYVDNTPIRVFKNKEDIGAMYPKQAMRVEASIWNGDSWATDGGETKINWSSAPFTAHFQGFNFGGCLLSQNHQPNNCDSDQFWWNQSKYWRLNHQQQKEYEDVRQKYMNYDYCDDRNRHPTPPPECEFNN